MWRRGARPTQPADDPDAAGGRGGEPADPVEPAAAGDRSTTVPGPAVASAPAPSRFPAAGFLGLGITCLALVAAVYAMAVLSPAGQRVENLALLGAEIRPEAERAASLARLGAVSLATFMLAIIAAIGLAAVQRRPGVGFLAAAVMGAGVVAVEILKVVLPRPEHVEGAVWLLRNSFPSGTAAVAMAIAVGGLMVAPGRLRWLALAAGAVLVAFVADALQVTGWHRLSDIVAGGLVVVAVAAFGSGAVVASGQAAPARRGAIHPGVYRLVTLLAVAAVGAGLVILAVLAGFPLLAEPQGSRRAFLQAAFPLIGAGASVLLVAAFARAIQPWTLGRRPGDEVPGWGILRRARPASGDGSEPGDDAAVIDDPSERSTRT